jgi:hypothetical protein
MTLCLILNKLMKYISILPFCIFYVLLTWLVRNNSFFWDSVLLGSVYGDWYYSHNFSKLFVPEEIAGYPPLFGMYIAAGWKLFGRSLRVSHFLMLPFLWGIVIQVYLLVKRFLPSAWVVLAMILLLLEPSLLAQSTQIVPDIVLVFLYLLCLNAALSGQRLLLALGLVFLAMISPRGTIAVVALFVTDILLGLDRQQAGNWFSYGAKKALAYLPAFMVTSTWLWLHYQQFGWIGYNSGSQWGAYTQIVGVEGLLKNIAVLTWRMLDFGRIVIWLVALLVFARIYKTTSLSDPAVRSLFVLFLAPLLVYASVLLVYTNPIAHRYFLVVYVCFVLSVLYMLLQLQSAKLKVVLYCLMLAGSLGGHFIVYPDPVAKGWDATLAHLPYYHLRKRMISWMDRNGIPVESTGSGFPNLRPIGTIDLNEDKRAFAEADLGRNQYIFHSNIFNGFSDQQLQELEEQWILLHELRGGQVYIRLYKHPAH